MSMPEVPPVSVTQLTDQLKEVVEVSFPYVAVQGEVSNCSRAASGHIYLTLKDQHSQIRAVVWKSSAARLKFKMNDGLEVIVMGAVEVYAARGSYQLIADRVTPVGLGPLELAFRQLHDKLRDEGLFDSARKRPIPTFPCRIALVTSPTGAAVRDLLQVITRRWPNAQVVIVPVPVQGDRAAKKIAAALRVVHLIPDVDVVIAGRGGGSLEDLWAFNEEVVARAIYDCEIPVISAVGHEVDVSIADLVADRRALTPSEAGELVVPSYRDVSHGLNGVRQRLANALREQAIRARLRLDSLRERRVFQRPADRIHDANQRIDQLAERMQRAVRRSRSDAGRQVESIATRLDALSPLKVLGRGYSLTKTASGQLVHSVDVVQTGDELRTILPNGTVTSEVTSISTDPPLAVTQETPQAG